ncbi:MAPEG family protein [Pelagibacterium xiamenense]|uniref:MAPEG family protein n=1 Tax=Pelagibacterium xiamenense TaxID=2901140 RepID=UPI001E57ACA2|nr:MAPEG family protein [Pelagibacterium xiamenense]MCD7058341.1 MAPEG family protein [Pelagibacterium xiamenense]
MSLELTLLVWSVVLLFVQISIQAVWLTVDLGSEYNASPRDAQKPLGTHAARAKRMLDNFLETYPAFVGLALTTVLLGTSNGLTQWGAGIYFAFRVFYIPLYLAGVAYIRSLVWIAASAGLAMMVLGLLL